MVNSKSCSDLVMVSNKCTGPSTELHVPRETFVIFQFLGVILKFQIFSSVKMKIFARLTWAAHGRAAWAGAGLAHAGLRWLHVHAAQDAEKAGHGPFQWTTGRAGWWPGGGASAQ
jgi:hypothetical protein